MLPDTWSVEMDESTGVPIVTIRGEVTVDDFQRFLSATAGSPGYWEHDKYLWDLRQATGFPSTSEIRRFANIARADTPPFFRIAIVVSRDELFGLTRMFEMLSDRLGVERCVFRDYDQAWIWLLTSKPAGDPG